MEEDEKTCRDCRSWEEDIYWTHFHFIHFFQFLHGDFRSHLAVPKKFAENMKNKLGENVFLKGPSGSIWKVGLAAEEEGLFFKRGWEEFVKDHHPLAENDVLMFKYNGNSLFEVLMFDHWSLCEKEASYFCKRREQMERDSEVGKKRKAREGPEVVIESPLPQDDAPRAPAEEPGKPEETVPTPTLRQQRTATRKRASPGMKTKAREGSEVFIEFPLPQDAPAEEPQQLEETVPTTTVRSRRIGTRKRASPGMKRKSGEGFKVVIESPSPQVASARAPVEEPQKPGETLPTATVSEHRILTRKRASFGNIGKASSSAVIDQEKKGGSLKSLSVSGIPPIKEKVMRRRSAREGLRFTHTYVSRKIAALGKSPEQVLAIQAIQQAQAAMKSESFLVVMRPSHVHINFYLSIPVEWADKHLSPCNQRIILRMKDRTWTALYYYTSRNCGGISASGWRSLVLENNLQESDVCLFDLGDSIDGMVVLDVTIFRAVESATPALTVSQASAPATDGLEGNVC
ncbi:uncharacterized protein LOC116205829 [Punica granatum]|uniref:TF-B3 domain-containing protein n=2 Tax=Punica granatum TaxID=22663 RepID=A0A218XF21_PUNGR|nr:uncharacterized protein LOC116205829 [Punica granatum]OWM83350.1 hypothetical protein CDL15_Pgr012831 [Punica granatum]PKI66394.1 hypothetical protein CRG98_013196 [Punica granatum]